MRCKAFLVLAVALGGSPAAAQLGAPGDILVKSGGTVLRIEPTTGRETVLFRDVPGYRMTLEPSGDLIFAGSQHLARVDAETGVATMIWTGGFGNNAGLAVAPGGTIFEAKEGTGDNSVWSIDPVTGAATRLFGDLDCVLTCGRADIGGIALAPDGTLAISLNGTYQDDPGALLRADPATGAVSVISSGGLLDDSYGVTRGSDGAWLVAVGSPTRAVVRVDPATGAQSAVTQGDKLIFPVVISTMAGGHAALVDQQVGLFDLDLATGEQRLITPVGYLQGPVVLPGVPAPAECVNGIDDDADGRVDYPADSGCSSARDGTERPPCMDGIDNDRDGKIDFPADPGCGGRSVRHQEAPQCDDGRDNDGDGLVDLREDPECLSSPDNSEHWMKRRR